MRLRRLKQVNLVLQFSFRREMRLTLLYLHELSKRPSSGHAGRSQISPSKRGLNVEDHVKLSVA
jgi:hypothetical protein